MSVAIQGNALSAQHDSRMQFGQALRLGQVQPPVGVARRKALVAPPQPSARSQLPSLIKALPDSGSQQNPMVETSYPGLQDAAFHRLAIGPACAPVVIDAGAGLAVSDGNRRIPSKAHVPGKECWQFKGLGRWSPRRREPLGRLRQVRRGVRWSTRGRCWRAWRALAEVARHWRLRDAAAGASQEKQNEGPLASGDSFSES